MPEAPTREWLDSQYNVRAIVKDRDYCVSQYHELSAAARDTLACQLDLPFGATEAERLDFFPARPTPAPLVFFIHGGYWRAQDKGDFSYIATPFNARGISFVSMNYQLAPAGTLDAMAEQVCRAAVWARENSEAFGIDRSRIFLAGHSAGAHLAAMAMQADWRALGLDENPFRGAVLVSGLFDLDPVRRCFVNDVLNLDEAAAARNSPILHLDRVDADSWRQREVIFCVGGEETDEFKRQQDDFVAAWKARGLPVQVVEEPGLNHYSVILELGRPGSPLFDSVLAMIERTAPQGRA
ncbi:MAG: alpha/beta hydrolase [Pseudorhodoplanes sp.]